MDQSLMAKIAALSPEKQQQVAEFVDALLREHERPRERKSLRGISADLNVDISAEDIDEARREMWSNFPREDIIAPGTAEFGEE